MRDRRKTIESLKRVAERPGSPNEGEMAHRLLAQLGVKPWTPRVFSLEQFPRGTSVFYCYWAYRNDHGTIECSAPKATRGELWMRIKFDRLKAPRWVPVTSPLGCHIDTMPFTGNGAETLYRMNLDWEEDDRKLLEKLRARGWVATGPTERIA